MNDTKLESLEIQTEEPSIYPKLGTKYSDTSRFAYYKTVIPMTEEEKHL